MKEHLQIDKRSVYGEKKTDHAVSRTAGQTAWRTAANIGLLAAPAGYPQEGVDAALADFARLAGDANAALLRDYVAAVLGRDPGAAAAGQLAAAAQPAADGAMAAVNGADHDAAAADGAAGQAQLFPREAALTGGQEAAPASTANTTGGSGGQKGASDRKGAHGRGRPPRHLVLQPIADKKLRGGVHNFFKAELRLPPMRTETSQSASKEGSNTVCGDP